MLEGTSDASVPSLSRFQRHPDGARAVFSPVALPFELPGHTHTHECGHEGRWSVSELADPSPKRQLALLPERLIPWHQLLAHRALSPVAPFNVDLDIPVHDLPLQGATLDYSHAIVAIEPLFAATTMNPTTSLLGRLTRLPLSSLSVIVGLVIAATPANGFFFFQWPDNAYQCNVRAAERRPHGTACAD